MSKKKIMIVDDNTDLLKELEEILENEGYETSIFSMGAPALKKLSSFKPDLVLLDINLPDESGYHVAFQMRQNENGEKIPIISMSGYYTEETQTKLLDICGIEKHIVKPFNPEELIGVIKDYLAEKSG